MKIHIKFILPYILMVIMMYISYDVLAPGKDADKLLNKIIANIDEDIVYTYINYSDINEQRPLEAYIFTKQEHSIKIFRLLPRYSIYNEHLRGLKINDISVFDVASQKLSVFFSTDDISNKNAQFVEAYADTPKMIASITPDQYSKYTTVFVFGIKKEGNTSSYLSTNGVKVMDTKELYLCQLEKDNMFVVEEFKVNNIPIGSSDTILSLWNYYSDTFDK